MAVQKLAKFQPSAPTVLALIRKTIVVAPCLRKQQRSIGQRPLGPSGQSGRKLSLHFRRRRCYTCYRQDRVSTAGRGDFSLQAYLT